MAQLREFFKKNPAAGYAVAGLFLALAAYLLATQLLGGPAAPPPPAAQPPARPAPAAAPRPAPAPAEAAPPSVSAAVVPTAPMGRPDPFVPLVSQATAAPAAPRPPASPLPPPPFPMPGTPLPPPPLPGAPAPAPAPAPVPPSPTAGISVSGIVSDQSKVVIVSIGGRTEILFEGESAGDLRVVKIDANRRTVTFERAGQRFDVTMGGG